MEVSQCVGHGALACTAKIRVCNGALHVKRTCGSVTVCWPWCTGLHRQDSCLQRSPSREENVWKCHSVLAMVHWLAPPRVVLATGALHVKRTCGSVTVCWPWCTGLHRQESCWQRSPSREENVWKCHSVLAMVHWLAPPRFVLAMELFT